jgi:polysaccharide export outer membrane protein
MIPEQIVGADGAITVPYAGRIQAAGRTPKDVEDAIVRSLQGKALEPQAVVTVGKNVSNAVTVVGEVTSGARIPLNTGGNRILDAIAQAGGTRAPVHETFVMLMRNQRSVRIPMQAILADPKENIYLFPNDVVTVTREPQTFTAVGATGQNAVLPFDAVGLTLDQAIARAGGLNDQRADPAGVFVIRFEPVANYDKLGYPRPTPDATKDVPVIYHINLRDPTSFFLAHQFPINNKDILYVSNSPLVEVQKVMTVINNFIVPGATVAAFAAAIRR